MVEEALQEQISSGSFSFFFLLEGVYIFVCILFSIKFEKYYFFKRIFLSINNATQTNVPYATAIGTLISGIIMCFLSFFLNKYMIESSVLMYFGEALVFCAGVFGLNLVIKNKIMEAETRINNKIEKEIQKANSSNTDEQLP